MDLFSYTDKADEQVAEKPMKKEVLTVTQLSNQLRLAVERQFGSVALEGEISGLKIPASGHMYFNLKDDDNVINAIIWRGTAQQLAFALEEGMQVVAHGKVTTYGARSNYQIVINRIEPAGIGALMQRFEQLKNQLTDEGLFDEHLKKEIPYLPKKIGIITSPTGAVIDDMKHRIEDRFPSHVMLAPVLVQGVGAKEQIAAAVEGFNALPKEEQPDVLIVARGGGSLEDLWAFNEEIVVRAIAASDIPVVSAVGHEPDVTLCDFVADLRAPTPTAAAEMVVPVRHDLIAFINDLSNRLNQGMSSEVANLKKHVMLMAKALPDPQSQLNQARMRLDDRNGRLLNAIQQSKEMASEKFSGLSARISKEMMIERVKMLQTVLNEKEKLLESYSPEGPLKRGYAYVKGADGELVRSSKVPAQDVRITFHDGEREASLK